MKRLPFEKWHGLGNDFILGFADDGWSLGEGRHAERLCDRHRGIGADGLLIVGQSPRGMTVFNADGSLSEMCGNGLRCVAAAIFARSATAGWFELATGAGPHAVRRLDDGDVEVRMPRPQLVRDGAGSPLVRPRTGWTSDGYRVSTGNPHWVFLEPDGPPPLREVGPLLEYDPQFPDRVNVEFVRRLPDGALRVDVWERGCGITQACGTGAAAVAEVWRQTAGLGEADAVTVELPGGRLSFRWEEEAICMRGPAVPVFAGTVAL